MRTEDRPYLSDELNDLFAEGKARGRAEGRAEGVLALLTAHGIDVPDEVKDAIMTEKNLAVLGVYLDRAVTAATAAEVIEPITELPADRDRPGTHL